MPLPLAVVMPVYNEEACIAQVLQAWRDALSAIPVPFLFIVLNDGSKDGTAAALKPFESDPQFRIITKPNSGHGPTILQGYREAVREAEWIFQCDSDDEMPPADFARFWSVRHSYDALFAVRHQRHQPWDRWLITRASRILNGLLFGFGVKDANVPYRLFRREVLERFLPLLPDDTFAPNLILSGASVHAHLRLVNIPVPHANRKTGKPSLANLKLWKSAFRAFRQTWLLHRVIQASIHPEK
ncbi:MAG: glycosyltransferase family 2 protein [Kiritimatiellia bacterium]